MKHYMKEVAMPWFAVQLGSNQANEIMSKFEIRGIPTCILVDADGNRIQDCPLRGDIEGIKRHL